MTHRTVDGRKVNLVLSGSPRRNHRISGPARGSGGGRRGHRGRHRRAYTDLARRHSDDTARTDGQANQSAVEYVAQLVAEEAIDCDFRRVADGQVHAVSATCTHLGCTVGFNHYLLPDRHWGRSTPRSQRPTAVLPRWPQP
ncbi:hypothetical protein [Pseudarthrobacter sp. NBSH8]|uniref:hypothetical protein n=1 Tax=Pseudarthrobacter sp. NBSH8 TaxID=2596911 RepID=UPI00162587B8|nr:hypothetical protein [Pseudarthrobacter sp. NBSH8]QNE14838.1 hypothetical protein FYJ92_10645 [Pseudarthrobacter sp. NBSH8]